MKESGIGRENGLEAFEACECWLVAVYVPLDQNAHTRADTQSKSTIINTATMEDTRSMQDWFAESAEAKRYG